MEVRRTLPIKSIRGLLDGMEERIEDAIMAHGFSFSALNVDELGAEMRFAQESASGGWLLTFRLPHQGKAVLSLWRGAEAEPMVALTLRVDGQIVESLAGALAVAMHLLNAMAEA